METDTDTDDNASNVLPDGQDAENITEQTEQDAASTDDTAPIALVQPVNKQSSSSLAPTAAETAQNEIKELLNQDLDEASASALQTVFRENEGLKGKVAKLKSLLGRSAKAQRESKVELESSNKKLEAAVKENERLKQKLQKLSTRPSHMDLINDFETNFDRAILSVAPAQQSGGQDTRAEHQQLGGTTSSSNLAAMESMLTVELSESKQRVQKLENMNATLVQRTSTLEGELEQTKQSMDSMISKLSVLELEKRMAVMESEHAKKEMEAKEAEFREMQLEIDLISTSAQKAAVRAAAGEEVLRSSVSDKKEIQKLRAQVQALQEWAEASNVAKIMAQERVRHLEERLVQSKQSSSSEVLDERVLTSDKGSLVVGAGDMGSTSLVLAKELIKTVRPLHERVVLRWTFDLSDPSMDITFRIVAGADPKGGGTILLKDRTVVGGAGGETDSAFDAGGSCTLVWSNKRSWIRPKTVKYSVSAVVLKD